MAARLPAASFVGIDLAPRPIAEANAFARDLGLANVVFHAADLRDLPDDGAPFDYVIAHGFYSWVPAPVREALFETLRARLAPRGIAFISHNTLPGCAFRRVVWDVLKPQVMHIDSPVERSLGGLDSSRSDGKTNFLRRLNVEFARASARLPRLFINDIAHQSAVVGLERWHEKRHWFSYKLAVSPAGTVTLAQGVAAIVRGSVPAPPTSTVRSTPLPSVASRTAFSQSGFWR